MLRFVIKYAFFIVKCDMIAWWVAWKRYVCTIIIGGENGNTSAGVIPIELDAMSLHVSLACNWTSCVRVSVFHSTTKWFSPALMLRISANQPRKSLLNTRHENHDTLTLTSIKPDRRGAGDTVGFRQYQQCWISKTFMTNKRHMKMSEKWNIKQKTTLLNRSGSRSIIFHSDLFALVNRKYFHFYSSEE